MSIRVQTAKDSPLVNLVLTLDGSDLLREWIYRMYSKEYGFSFKQVSEVFELIMARHEPTEGRAIWIYVVVSETLLKIFKDTKIESKPKVMVVGK